MKRALLILTTLSFSNAYAQFELPDTSIWLIGLLDNKVQTVERITSADGYHNQPAFSHDGSHLYFTQGKIAEDGLGYTDIYCFALNTKTTLQITDTTTSEFSPTPMPDSMGLSTVRVQAGGKQELWAVFPGSDQPEHQLVSAEPVGYHLWLSDGKLALFILDGDQNRLEEWMTGANSGQTIANNIGRSLIAAAQPGNYYFIQNPQYIMLQSSTGKTSQVIDLPENTADFTRAPDDSLWTGVESQLQRMPADGKNWQIVEDMASRGITQISRLTFSPDGSQLALVSNTP